MPLFDQRKIGFNFFEDSLCFALAKAIFQPWAWLMILFQVITAAISMAQWNHVGGNSPWASWRSKRYPVIHGQRPFKAFLSASIAYPDFLYSKKGGYAHAASA